MAKAYAFKFARVTISGSMHNSSEHWSTGFQMGSPTADMVDAQAPAAQSIATAWATFWTTAANKISYQYFAHEVKVAIINTNGKTDVEKIDYYNWPAPIQGGGAAVAPYPPQITLAATLTTNFQRGLASKGRMYLPGIAEPIDAASGKIATAYRDTLANNFKTFLDSVNTAAGVPGKIVVASAGNKTQALDIDGQPIYQNGRTAWVTGCRIGSVYDTQRRRRNDLSEVYSLRVLA